MCYVIISPEFHCFKLRSFIGHWCSRRDISWLMGGDGWNYGGRWVGLWWEMGGGYLIHLYSTVSPEYETTSYIEMALFKAFLSYFLIETFLLIVTSFYFVIVKWSSPYYYDYYDYLVCLSLQKTSICNHSPLQKNRKQQDKEKRLLKRQKLHVYVQKKNVMIFFQVESWSFDTHNARYICKYF